MKLLNLLISLLSAAAANDDQWRNPTFESPEFDHSTPRNITAIQGKTAMLHCKVKRLNNKTVSWIRSRDLHILSVGSLTYTNDERFMVARGSARNDWTLMIKYAQRADSGLYECHISSQPPISYQVTLNIVEPEARVLGPSEVYIRRGSQLNLTCVITNSPEPPDYVFWYHGSQRINYDSSRGGVTVVNDKGDISSSQLLMKNARHTDSGVYICQPSNAQQASITVHVLEGENHAAMFSSCCPRPAASAASPLTVLLMLILWVLDK